LNFSNFAIVATSGADVGGHCKKVAAMARYNAVLWKSELLLLTPTIFEKANISRLDGETRVVARRDYGKKQQKWKRLKTLTTRQVIHTYKQPMAGAPL